MSQTSSQKPQLSNVWSLRRRWDTPSYAVANGVYHLRNLSWFPEVLSVAGQVSAASQVCSSLTNCWGKCQLPLLCKHFVVVLLWLSRCILMCVCFLAFAWGQRFVQRVHNDNVNSACWPWRLEAAASFVQCDSLYVLEPPGKYRKLQLAVVTAF